MSYTPPSGTLDPTWVGAEAYTPSQRVLLGNFSPDRILAPYGPGDGAVSDFAWTQQLFVTPSGIVSSSTPGSPLVTHDTEYIPPYATLSVSWLGEDDTYTPADDVLDAQWIVGGGAGTQYVFTVGFEGEIGAPLVWVYQFILPNGFESSQPGYTIIYREGEYPTLRGTLNASWVGANDYTPSVGFLGVGWLDATISDELRPIGIPAKIVGTPAIFLNTRYLNTGTINDGAIGTPFIDFGTHYVTPNGFIALVSGQAQIVNFDKELYPSGIAPPPATGVAQDRQLPPPMISFRTRYLLPTGIPTPTTQVPNVTVTHEFQFVDLAGRSILPGPFGTTRIEFSSREIIPPFIFALAFGVANVARIQVIQPSGWLSSDIPPGAQLDINLQRLFHHSGVSDPTEWGGTILRNEHEIIAPTGWLTTNINFPVVYNVDQYVFVAPYMNTNSDPTEWPNYYPFVENQDRVLGPGGFQSSRFSIIGNIIENAADPLYPAGLDSLTFGPETFIAYRIRTVNGIGWDSFYNTQYAVVYNAAAVVAPSGWVSSACGTPIEVLNLNREIKQFFPYTGETVGTAFIAYAIRTIYPNLFYDVPSGFPEVRFNPFPIAPLGMAPPQFGPIYVEERFTIIYPSSTNVHSNQWVGEPIVENENKTLRVFPSDQFAPGIPRVFNYIQYKEIGAGELLVIGNHLISYRTKNIYPVPAVGPPIVITHRIRNLIPDPPYPQNVFPEGIAYPFSFFPSPSFALRTIYVSSIEDTFAAGSPTVTTNNILPLSIYDDGMLGIPSIPTPQPLYPISIPPADSNVFANQVPSGIRFDPFHIYAPTGDQTPLGYHPLAHGAPISAGARFGVGGVTHFHRVIGPVPSHASGVLNRPTLWGDTEFALRTRVLLPYGIMSMRMPVPLFVGVPQYVEMGGEFGQPGISSTLMFGVPNIARYVAPDVDRTVPINGFVATLFGTHRVELLHRTITTPGIPHRGNPQQGLTNPWGQALVGFPRVYIITAGDLSLWGSHLIEYKNRTILGIGFSANTLDDDDIEERIDPMRVSLRNPPGSLHGIPSTLVFGTADVGHNIRTIFARGPFSYTAGTTSISAVCTIAPSGWDSFVAGDIDEWEAGKIKPYGDDLGVMGTPRMTRMIYDLEEVDTYYVGDPRVGRGVYVAGIPEIGFAGPSLSDIYGCSNRVVVPVPILSTQVVPQPSVA